VRGQTAAILPNKEQEDEECDATKMPNEPNAGIKNVFIQCLIVFTYGNKKPAVSRGLFIAGRL